MLEFARKLIALVHSHHTGTDFEEALQQVPQNIHPSWIEVTKAVYQAYREIIGDLPPSLRILKDDE